jgi:hypothetical protein
MEHNKYIQVKALLENVKVGDTLIYHEKVSFLSEIIEFVLKEEYLTITIKPLTALKPPSKSYINYYNYIIKQEELNLRFTLAYATINNSKIYSHYAGLNIDFNTDSCSESR